MKIRVLNSIAIIETAFTPEDVELLEAVDPSALELRDQDDNPMFVVQTGPTPSISNYGVVVSAKRDIVLQFDKPVTLEKVTEMYPKAFIRLPLLEQQVAEAAAHYRARLQDIDFEVV